MAKIKFTKNELKKQKDNLKRFTRYLPTLELKKQQLLLEIRNIQNKVDKLNSENPPPLSPETRALLISISREDIENLQALIGYDLSHWY